MMHTHRWGFGNYFNRRIREMTDSRTMTVVASIAVFFLVVLAVTKSVLSPERGYGLVVASIAVIEAVGAYTARRGWTALSFNLSMLLVGAALQGLVLHSIANDAKPMQSAMVMVALNQLLLISGGVLAQRWYQFFLLVAISIGATVIAFHVLPVGVEPAELYNVVSVAWTLTALSITAGLLIITLKARLRKTLQTRTLFLSTMRHELRNPLSALVGFCRLLNQRPLEQPLHTEIQHILGAAEHLELLIEILLELYTIETSGARPPAEAVPVEDIVRTLSANLKRLGGELEFQYLVKNEVPKGAAVYTRHYQLIIALTAVAAGFMRQRLTEKTIRVLILGHDNRVSIAMGNARGIDRFQKNAPTGRTKDDPEPIMLLAGNLVTELGHQFKYINDSTEQLCVIELPVIEKETASPEFHRPHRPPPAGPDKGPPYRVLYVEDDLANRGLMAMIFETRKDWELRTAPTGEQGVEDATAFSPHLVIMDISLPGISGIEAARRLKANPETRAIPVLALTATDQLSGLSSGKDGLFEQVIAKPFDINVLVSTVASLLAIDQQANRT